MKVTFDLRRILHLLTLIATTFLLGKVLIHRWEWSPLSAYGFTCTVTCHLSNALLKVRESYHEEGDGEKGGLVAALKRSVGIGEDDGDDAAEKRELRVAKRREERASAGSGSNPKKKRL